MKTHEYKRAYIWELPVRLFHWGNALAITVLIVTGIIIGNPPAILTNADPMQIYWFGIIRATHFITAYLLVAFVAIRFYWAFVGNKYARWKAYWPFSKENMKNIGYVLKVDVLLGHDREHKLSNISVGHNAVAGSAYLIFFLMLLVITFTGFGLYAPTSSWWFPQLFDWVPEFLGGDGNTRLVHHITMWLIILFIIVHVYLVFYHEWIEGRGEVSSIFSGYKFVRKERVHEDEISDDIPDEELDKVA